MSRETSAQQTKNQQKSPIRIANVSGAMFDPGFHMYNQATKGPIDALTGDYLAELNIATNAQAYRAGQHPGWEKTAEDGLIQTLEVIATKNIKVRGEFEAQYFHFKNLSSQIFIFYMYQIVFIPKLIEKLVSFLFIHKQVLCSHSVQQKVQLCIRETKV
jgi:hypothetical protein